MHDSLNLRRLKISRNERTLGALTILHLSLYEFDHCKLEVVNEDSLDRISEFWQWVATTFCDSGSPTCCRLSMFHGSGKLQERRTAKLSHEKW